VAILDQAGYTTLNDVIDLEAEDIAKIPGMTTESAGELLRFVTELTEDEPEGGEPAA
jgi:N utilization substance protein A